MLLAVIFVLLLISNWLITESLVFVPVNLLTRLTHIGWWGVAGIAIAFLAWCISDD